MVIRYASPVSAPTIAIDVRTPGNPRALKCAARSRVDEAEPREASVVLYQGAIYQGLAITPDQNGRGKPLKAHVEVWMRHIHRCKGYARRKQAQSRRIAFPHCFPANPEHGRVYPDGS